MAASVVDFPDPVGPVTSTTPARVIRDLREDPGALQVFERQDVGGDGTKYRARSPIVVEGVDAEARETQDLEGEVALQELLVVLALLVVHDVVDERMDLFVFQGWDIDAAYIAVHPDHGRETGREVQIRGPVLDRKRKHLTDIHHDRSPYHQEACPPCSHLPMIARHMADAAGNLDAIDTDGHFLQWTTALLNMLGHPPTPVGRSSLRLGAFSGTGG
jgi:hypothetical protein